MHIFSGFGPTSFCEAACSRRGPSPRIESIEEAEGSAGGRLYPRLTGSSCWTAMPVLSAAAARLSARPTPPGAAVAQALILDVRDRGWASIPALLWRLAKALVDRVPLLRRLASAPASRLTGKLVGEIVADETLWSCTTCGPAARSARCSSSRRSLHRLRCAATWCLRAGAISQHAGPKRCAARAPGQPLGDSPSHQAGPSGPPGLNVPYGRTWARPPVLYWLGVRQLRPRQPEG